MARNVSLIYTYIIYVVFIRVLGSILYVYTCVQINTSQHSKGTTHTHKYNVYDVHNNDTNNIIIPRYAALKRAVNAGQIIYYVIQYSHYICNN